MSSNRASRLGGRSLPCRRTTEVGISIDLLRARLEAQVVRPCRVRRRDGAHIHVELGSGVLLAVVKSYELDAETVAQMSRYAPEVWLVLRDRVVCASRGREPVVVAQGDRLRCIALPDIAIALDDVCRDSSAEHRLPE